MTNYKPKDFAELLGVSVKTLQRWDREGILK
ncbi:MerR family DNA-binding transcriptional regulator, partial [Gallintestinimicrobium sp.]|nr:MerR family DNA-binding transcriptional regulator [Roseburia sp.]